MKITVVGFWHAFPGKGEAASGYLLEKNGFRVLIDCGSGVISQLQHYCDLSTLDAAVISHYHNDHIGDIGALHYHRLLLPYLSEQKEIRPFPIYGHKEDREGFQRLSYKDVVQAVTYNDQAPLSIGPFTFTFYRTTHPVPCFAMNITDQLSTLFYTADTGFSEQLATAAQEADLIISECSLYKGQDGTKAGHMNSEEAGRFANIANARSLLLSHLPHFGEHRRLVEEAKVECPHTTVEHAVSGWTKII
ncbi:MBL fold metallo-hydrolase [Alteribacillus iranensis]|uniref:Ribonuclease BN, tRNA processing enzyme n=1 Tax=Alteribacillus iranensis TaxID=930128 RepID=A0A1I2CU93_9BACI|nr:MBL fold metallo-hydrolase [Alteribacillus iranensis]SFE71290.1 Ribonuclease BN, tRNA processing enzyme [Alteribacillus iranensis]